MPQGPPPGSFVGHGGGGGGIDLSKQTPPHHQSGHHPGTLPPGRALYFTLKKKIEIHFLKEIIIVF